MGPLKNNLIISLSWRSLFADLENEDYLKIIAQILSKNTKYIIFNNFNRLAIELFSVMKAFIDRENEDSSKINLSLLLNFDRMFRVI